MRLFKAVHRSRELVERALEQLGVPGLVGGMLRQVLGLSRDALANLRFDGGDFPLQFAEQRQQFTAGLIAEAAAVLQARFDFRNGIANHSELPPLNWSSLFLNKTLKVVIDP